jgi:hypothetical protein
VVVVLHVGGSKASDIKLVLQREPRNGKLKLGFLQVRYCLTRSLLMLLLVSYLKKLALL